MGKYSPEDPRENAYSPTFWVRNHNFDHFANEPQFPVFESRISPEFSKSNGFGTKPMAAARASGRRLAYFGKSCFLAAA